MGLAWADEGRVSKMLSVKTIETNLLEWREQSTAELRDS